MKTKEVLYFENLDALRFIAAMLVVGAHISTIGIFSAIPEAKFVHIFLSLDGAGGDIGVSFFFVLSGFLITYLMLKEYEVNLSFSVRNFYLRRALRIWPLYYLILLIGFVIYPLVQDPSLRFDETANPVLYLLFLANIDQMYFNGPHADMLGVLWSVSVEEQFYLLWPLIFLFIKNKKKIVWVLVGIILISNIYRISGAHKFHTLTALSDLSVGALAAYLSFFYGDNVRGFFDLLKWPAIVVVYFLGVSTLFLNFQLNKHIINYSLFDRLLHALFFAFVILDQNFSSRTYMKAGTIPFFNHFGKISYGIYMYHIIAILIAIHICAILQLNFYWLGIIALILTLIMSELSYRFFEGYFLTLKGKLVAAH